MVDVVLTCISNTKGLSPFVASAAFRGKVPQLVRVTPLRGGVSVGAGASE